MQYKNAVQDAIEIMDMLKRMYDQYDHFFEFATEADGQYSTYDRYQNGSVQLFLYV
jgi:hypothetical protein